MKTIKLAVAAVSVEQRVADALRGFVRICIGWDPHAPPMYECLIPREQYDRLWAPEQHPEKFGWKVERI